MMKALAVVAGLSLCASTAAEAETKSWAALKGKVPAGTIVLGGADVGALRGTPSFGSLVAWVRSEDKDFSGMLDTVKQTCGTELTAMFSDISVAIDAKEHGVLVIGFAGTDRNKVTDCLNKVIAKVEPSVKLTSKEIGKLTEYSLTGETEKLYTAWLSPDVIAISIEPKTHDGLDAMLQGSAASGDLAGFLGKTDPSLPAWVAFAPNDDVLKGGSGTLKLGKTLAIAFKIVASTPVDGEKGRKEMADTMKKGIERSAKQPDLKKVFQSVKVGGKGADVTVDASIPEASLPALIPALDKIF